MNWADGKSNGRDGEDNGRDESRKQKSDEYWRGDESGT